MLFVNVKKKLMRVSRGGPGSNCKLKKNYAHKMARILKMERFHILTNVTHKIFTHCIFDTRTRFENEAALQPNFLFLQT